MSSTRLNRRAALRHGTAVALGAVGGTGLVPLLSGCASPSRVRMDVLRADTGCPRTLAPTLLVLLPGAHMAPEELLREGFVQAIRERQLAVDVALPDANLGFAREGSLLRRLDDEVLAPALAEGRHSIWLAGISLGGFVALQWARQWPERFSGVLAMAPYLGETALLREIQAAGGAARWRSQVATAPVVERDRDSATRALWRDLADPARSRQGPPVWLSTGEADRLRPGHELLASLMLPSRVDRLPGGHDWDPWRALWARWLDRGLLPRQRDALMGCRA